jgi:hypothetical protein
MMSPCAFIIRMSMPLLTMRGIFDLLLNRCIKVKSINLQCFNDLDGVLILHCNMEKDRIRYTGGLLEKVKGVIEVEILQAHVSNLIKLQ